MKINQLAIVLLILSFSFIACEENPPMEDGIFSLSFSRNGDTGEAVDGFPVFENNEGRKFYFENFSFYVSEITLFKENGESMKLIRESDSSDVILYDWVDVRTDNEGDRLFQNFDVPAGTYTGISFGIGVPEVPNHSDPTNYPAEHPLSEFRGKHWTWNAGYRFIMADGFIDDSDAKDGPMDLGFKYHLGMDTLYRNLEFKGANDGFEVKSGSTYTYGFDLDPTKMFYNANESVDMVNDNITHTGDFFSVAKAVADNFVNNALSKKE